MPQDVQIHYPHVVVECYYKITAGHMIIMLLSHGMDRQSLVDHHSVSQTLEIKHFSVMCGLMVCHVDYVMRQ